VDADHAKTVRRLIVIQFESMRNGAKFKFVYRPKPPIEVLTAEGQLQATHTSTGTPPTRCVYFVLGKRVVSIMTGDFICKYQPTPGHWKT